MAPARPVEPGFSPLDEELGLLPGSLSPQYQEHLSRLAVWMPFERAAQMLAALTGVQVSEATTRRQTYTAGAAYEAVQAAQALTPPDPGGGSPTDQLVISADGAMVPLVHGQWAEVKTLVIGEMAAGQEAGEAQCRHLSYFSRMSEASVTARAGDGGNRAARRDGGQAGVCRDGWSRVD